MSPLMSPLDLGCHRNTRELAGTPNHPYSLILRSETAATSGFLPQCPRVLVSQVQAGGVGLDIQAASVVVITEPQVKPTIEWQAIARAHRMGQARSLQVHRLLSEESVDERMVQILSRERRTFDDFAAISEMAERAPEAVDVSEGDLVRQVVEAEQRRLFPDRNVTVSGEQNLGKGHPARPSQSATTE